MLFLLSLTDKVGGLPVWAWIVAAAVVLIALIIIIIVSVKIVKIKREQAEQQELPQTAETESYKSAAQKPAAQTAKEPAAQTVKEPAAQSSKAEAVQSQKVEEKTSVRAAKAYHVTKRASDGKWQVKSNNGQKAIKLFSTQAEAISYAKTLAQNQDASVRIHKEDGTFRKTRYNNK